MASRKLEDLHPLLQTKVQQLLKECEKQNIKILIYCTYRSPKEQDELYALGRTKPGRIVTYLRGGQSKHNYEMHGKPASLAFDFVPIVNGKLMWDDKELYKQVGEIAKKLGLIWGGDWKKFKDMPHIEMNL